MNCANHPDRERTAFCQNCGKPLCQECTRTVGSAIYCEPCLVARLAGTGQNPVGGYTGPVYTEGAVPPPPAPPDEPNPGLAALLGFIPGVGAMYNGQYAKGIVHLIVFAVLVSLAGQNGIFGLFIAGWVFYQVIEAHHTARARRDGTPLPNPFGLNDLGERLGFGKSWPSGNPNPYGQTTATSSTEPPVPPASSPYQGYPPPPPPSWGAPYDNFVPPPVPPVSPYAGTTPTDNPYASRNHFPTGAIWLIALGAIFLIGNSIHGYPFHWFVPLLLIGFGVWLFVRKMTETGTLADDGSALYRIRLFHALRGAIWIILVGVLFLLDSAHILSWGRSWPLFIIVAGLMAIFQRASFSAAAAASYNPYANPYAAPSAPPQEPKPSSGPPSIIPHDVPHDEEGR
ncbi:MAG TPA: B-box zinc finger protein [Edaphobacter sp.]|nr:B-box zinc finger protein [Edaphobacter sp.]